jgi:hypothetical protein
MDLSTRTQAFVDGLDEDAAESFLSMSVQEQDDYIALSESFSAADVRGIELEMAKAENENMPILRVGMAPLVAGAKIAARLKGTRFIYSKEHKENWKKFKASNGDIYYTNSYSVFENLKTGKEFGIWSYATLRILEKIPTKEVYGPTSKFNNPIVQIEYLGKIEGRDVLAKDHGIILTEGSSAHVFKVEVEKGHPTFQYEAGCLNPLNSPTPIVRNGEKVDRVEATKSRFDKLAALNGNNNGLAIETTASVQ